MAKMITDEVKERIKLAREFGLKYRQICKKFNISLTLAWKIANDRRTITKGVQGIPEPVKQSIRKMYSEGIPFAHMRRYHPKLRDPLISEICKDVTRNLKYTHLLGKPINGNVLLAIEQQKKGYGVIGTFTCSCGRQYKTLVATMLKRPRKWCSHKCPKYKEHCTVVNTRIHTKHGESVNGKKTPEYYSWSTMVQRCTNPNAHEYANYGGRGISVCERWRNYMNFLEDMGRRPQPSRSYTLDRIDVNGNYEPMNCRWITRSDNCKRKKHKL